MPKQRSPDSYEAEDCRKWFKEVMDIDAKIIDSNFEIVGVEEDG